jgi:gliding motility-associated-like protein/uncharacterized repeat protein (TIGR01451 family)
MKTFTNYLVFALFVLTTQLIGLGNAFAQNCSNNNVFIVAPILYDEDGEEFGDADDYNYTIGDPVTAQIFAEFGGSTNNGYNLYVEYDVFIDGEFRESVQICFLFQTENITHGEHYIADIVWEWGLQLEVRNFYMDWQTGNAPSTPKDRPCEPLGRNAQCYWNPGGFIVRTPLVAGFYADSTCENGTDYQQYTFTSTTSGGYPPYTLVWDFDGGTQVGGTVTEPIVEFSTGGPKIIRQTATDSNNNSNTYDLDITVECCIPDAPLSGGDEVICEGEQIPALTVTVSAPGNTADWYSAASGGTLLEAGTLSFTPTSAGTYYAEARNTTSGCTSEARTAVVLTINPTPELVITDPDPVCESNTVDLTAAAITTGSTLPTGTTLSYWLDEDATQALVDPTAVATSETYYIKAATAAGCFDIQPVEVTINPAPEFSMAETNASCFGGSDGKIQVDITSGLSPFEVSLDNVNWVTVVGSSYTFENLTADNYTIYVRDDNGCISQDNETVGEPDVLNAVVNSENVSCFGGDDGSITITSPLGGSGDFEYSIDGGTTWQASGTFGDLEADTYVVQIRDANSTDCVITLDAELEITEPDVLEATVDSDNVTCFGGDDGSITITSPLGGSGDFEYSIDGGTTWQVSGTFGDLEADTYVVQIRDANSTDCVITLDAELEITEPDVLEATVDSDNVTCFGGDDGSITITSPLGGSGDFEYSIDGGTTWQVSGTFGDLEADTYVVQIRDANNTDCVITLDAELEITEPDVLEATVDSDNVTCFGGDDGSITITSPLGGSGDFEYSIDGGTTWQVSGTFGDLEADTYVVQIRDANNTDCVITLDAELEITEPDVLEATVDSDNVTCFGGDDGSITITSPLGGSGDFEYSIDGGTTWQVSGTFGDLEADTYVVQIRDANSTDCVITLDAELEITEPDVLEATVDSDNVTCFGGDDGSITITSPLGGSGDFEYSIDGGTTWQVSGTFGDLEADTYVVQIRDANSTDCVITLDAELEITEPDVLEATVDSDNVTCFGGDDGSITITSPLGGSGDFEYSIDGGTTWQVSGTFGDLEADTYVVQIRDANNTDCVITLDAELEITEPDVLEATVDSDNVTCFGGDDGSITITSPLGGSGDFEYSIDGGTTWQVSGTFGDLEADTYVVQIRDANSTDCVITLDAELEITEPDVLEATVDSDNVTCFGGDDGSITITSPLGGSGDFEYSIDGGTTWQVSGTFGDLEADTYVVQIRDANSTDCVITLDAELEITEPDELVLVVSDPDPVCDPNTVDLTTAVDFDNSQLTGGSLTYHGPLPSTTEVADETAIAASGTYVIRLTLDTNEDCYDEEEVEVTINPLPIVNDQTPGLCEDFDNPGSVSDYDLTLLESSINNQGGMGFTYFTDSDLNDEISDPTSHPVSDEDIIYVVVTNPTTNCTDVATITFTISETITVNDQTPAFCEEVFGDGEITEVDLSDYNDLVYPGGAGVTYEWFEFPDRTGPVTTPSSLTIEDGDVYYVQVTDGLCVNEASVTFTINPLPAVPDGEETVEICENEEIPALTVTVGQGITVDWFDVAVGGDPILTGSLSYTPTEAGTFYAEARDETTGCISSARLEVTLVINELPVVSAANQTIPYGTSTQILASVSDGESPYTFAWTPANLLVDATVQNPTTINLTETTVFTLVVTDANGCIASDDATITVEGEELTVDPSASPTPICEGETSQLFANANGGAGNLTYSWTSDPAGFVSTEINPVIAPETTTTYFVTVTDELENTASESVVVVVNPIPEIECPEYGPLCVDSGPITFTEPGVFTLNGEVVTGFDPVSPGVYTFVYTFTSVDGCSASCEFDIVVNELPAVSCAGLPQTVCVTTGIFPLSSDVPGDGTFSGDFVVNNTFNALLAGPGIHIVTYTVTDPETGCSNSCDFVITVVDEGEFSIAKSLLSINGEPGITQYNAVGDVILYEILVENTGTVTLQDIAISDPNATTVSGSPIASLEPGETAIVTASITVTQQHIDNGSISNTASGLTNTICGPATATSNTVVVEAGYSGGLIVTKSADVETYSFVGDVITYTITVENASNFTINNVVVSDPLVNFESLIGTMEPGESQIFEVTYEISQDDLDAGSFTNVAAATGLGPDGEGVSAEDDETVNAVILLSELDITKEANPSQVFVGDQVTYTMVISNNNQVPAINVVVSDELPEGVSFVSASDGGSYDAQSNTVTWSLGDLAADSNISISLVVEVDLDVADGTVITNFAVANNDNADFPAESNPAPVTVIARADLMILKGADVGSAFNGEQVTYTFTVTNLGPSAAQNVVVSDLLPPQVSFVSASDGGVYNADNHSVSWTMETMASEASMTLTLVVRVNLDVTAGTAITNFASVTSDTEDPDGDNNEDSVTITGSGPRADVAVVKSVDGGTILAGSNFSYTITVTNHGPSAATNISVVDNLPAQANFVSASDGGTYNAGARSVSWTIASLASGQSQNFTITLYVPSDVAGGTMMVNEVTANSEVHDPEPENNTYIDQTPVTTPELFIPDVFSPNNDGVNDRWIIRGLDRYPNNKVVIINRWGNRVFEAAPYNNDWDGTNQFSPTVGGNELPIGTYYYILDLGSDDVRRGFIYLTR